MSCTAQSSRPRGAPEAFARRVLGTAPAEGLKIEQILDKAEPPAERDPLRHLATSRVARDPNGRRTLTGSSC